jgi:hypothetical protein
MTRSTSSAASAVAVPDFEVKLFLDPAKVLDVEFKPTRAAERTLGLQDSNRKIAMLFLDGRPALLDPEGWNVRVRKFEGEEKFELSYKRRYRIEPGKLPDALAAAATDGFHAQESDYRAQVEWGFERQRLSFTRKKDFRVKGLGGMNLPTVEEVRKVALEGLPGKLDRQKQPGWARGVLTAGHLYGPVLGKRWTGDWQGPDLSFEVWLIKTGPGPGYEPVVELSFKEAKQAKAADYRDKLRDFVRDQQWLIGNDVLKTKMILERY